GPALYWMGPAAMLLSMLRPRFICLSYGAGLIFLLSRGVGFDMDIAGICGLVGILHLAEGILVLTVGGRHTVSVYGRKENELCKKSGICRVWPVPICLLIGIEKTVQAISMPKWWPLLTATAPHESLALLPLAVTVGYSDLANQKQEVEQRRWLRGSLILGYALGLLALSIWCGKMGTMGNTSIQQWMSVMWMVAGHEAIVLYPGYRTKHASKFLHKNKLETKTGCVYNRMK
ncbi:MAG: hypothetical protein IKU17_00840, partial [Clostridia bacterium]|nr:hypothetical protein [Clostridia bacterium]